MNAPTKRAAFFFGSGISFDSGVPSVDDITKKLLNSAWESHSNGRFYPVDSGDVQKSIGKAELAQKFLRFLNDYINPHIKLRQKRSSNYEDLFAAAVQIVQDENAAVVNPLIHSSVSEIRNETSCLYKDYPELIENNRFASLAQDATRLIQWAVRSFLLQKNTPIGMEMISATAKAAKELDIFTLNHDLLIEQQLEKTPKTAYADGFEKSGDARKFSWLWNDGSSVRLYKLHGSIDWYSYSYNDGSGQFAKVIGDSDHCKDSKGNPIYLRNSDPLFLTGTTNKERLYGIGLPGEFFHEFHERLKTHNSLICCGYGWSDNGINNRLSQWVLREKGNRIVILHKPPHDELIQKRFWINRWGQLNDSGRLFIVPKWLSECSVEDLEPYFDS